MDYFRTIVFISAAGAIVASLTILVPAGILLAAAMALFFLSILSVSRSSGIKIRCAKCGRQNHVESYCDCEIEQHPISYSRKD